MKETERQDGAPAISRLESDKILFSWLLQATNGSQTPESWLTPITRPFELAIPVASTASDDLLTHHPIFFSGPGQLPEKLANKCSSKDPHMIPHGQ